MNDTIINDVCLLIPSCPRHFHYIYNILDSILRNDISIDIYIVFSSDSDYQLFDKKDMIKPIFSNASGPGIVNIKKFDGLKYLRDSNINIKYVIVTDSELCINPINFTKSNIIKKIESIFDNKILYAGKVTDVSFVNINRISSNVFDHVHQRRLGDLTDNFSLYHWWGDLPVYRISDLTHFFNSIDDTNILFHHFDNIIYNYYLILFHGFSIINITNITGIPYSMEYSFISDTRVLNKLLDISLGFGWVVKRLYNMNTMFFDQTGTFLMFHLDR